MNETLLVAFVFITGALLRPVLLYLRAWLDTRAVFDWRYLIGQIVAVAIAVIPVAMLWADQLTGVGAIAALALGWAAADIGRETQKTFWK
jgi:hypothetical protein